MALNICTALFRREVRGSLHFERSKRCLSSSSDGVNVPRTKKLKLTEDFEDEEEDLDEADKPQTQSNKSSLLNIRIRIDDVIPQHALQSGHIVMGFTQCNRYILSYTIRPVHNAPHPAQNENRPLIAEYFDENLYTYKLHMWRFQPHGVSKKFSSVLLFDRNGVNDGNLILQMCQWKFEGFDNDRFLVVVGRSSTPEDNPRCYLTLTQLPPTATCAKCIYASPSSLEYTQVVNPCPLHSLTVSATYELVSPFPIFDPEVSLYLTEDDVPTVLINNGNMLHQIQYNPNQSKPNKSNILKAEVNQQQEDLNYYFRSLVPTNDKKERRFFKRTKQTPLERIDLKTLNKPDVYDVICDEDSKIDKNYRLFRNRQLADKKYEFVDENVRRPLRSSNKKSMHPRHESSSNLSSTKTLHIKKCTARVTRSYVLLNDDSVSTTTEVEDNDYNFNEYPVALPVNVYTDQTQLSMIPNYKTVEKKVMITQTTLDIEILSNEVAAIMCNNEGLRFMFLIDFDTAILQVHPTESTVTALVILLIQASSNEDVRLRYETNFLICWNPATHSSKLLFKGKLKQVVYNEASDKVWNPITNLPIKFVRLYRQQNPHLNNNYMVSDWISVDEITDSAGVVTLYREKIPTSTLDDDEDDIASIFSD